MSLNKLRWEALGEIGVQFQFIKNYIKNKYNVDIVEATLPQFIDNVENKYFEINQEEALFDLEDTAYRKLAIFSLREKECDELNNIMFREHFLCENKLNNTVNNKNPRGIDEVLYPCYVNITDAYATIKMAQLRTCMIDEFDEDNVVTSISKTYYHCTKFVVDLQRSLVFLFYNDISYEGEELGSKGKAVTEKKQAFYNLFSEGTQATLIKLSIDSYLNNYIKDYLENIEESGENSHKSVVVIETSDPIEPKNNLRSSKKDGGHNKYRLNAIKYALDNENHTVKMMECNINGRWFQFRQQGEIITSGPYFAREVIESVCKEIFPDYKISQTEFATGT